MINTSFIVLSKNNNEKIEINIDVNIYIHDVNIDEYFSRLDISIWIRNFPMIFYYKYRHNKHP